MNQPTPPNQQQPPVEKHPFAGLERKWNKLTRILKYFILSCVILTILEIGLAYWLVSSRWHLLLSSEEMIEYAEEVNQAEPLPENFTQVYTAIFPNHVKTTLTQQVFVNYGTRFLFRHTELDDKPHCFCDMVYDIMKKKHRELEDVEWDGRLQDLEFGFGLEKYTTPEQCFYYVMQYRIPELLGQLSSQKKYEHLMGKQIAEFSDDEVIELVLLLKSRSRYNRHKNPHKFDKAFVHYKQKVEAAQNKNTSQSQSKVE